MGFGGRWPLDECHVTLALRTHVCSTALTTMQHGAITSDCSFCVCVQKSQVPMINWSVSFSLCMFSVVHIFMLDQTLQSNFQRVQI
jgi:hypothetical protein